MHVAQPVVQVDDRLPPPKPARPPRVVAVAAQKTPAALLGLAALVLGKEPAVGAAFEIPARALLGLVPAGAGRPPLARRLDCGVEGGESGRIWVGCRRRGPRGLVIWGIAARRKCAGRAWRVEKAHEEE